MTRKYSFTDNDLLNLRSEGLSFPEMGRRLNVPRDVIKYHMNLLGYRISRPHNHYRFQSKYEYDRYYFDNIDTANKAYFLGLIYADGCNFKNGTANTVSLCLNHIDKYILKKLKLDMKSNIPLRINRGQTEFKIHDRYFSDNLIKKGVVPRKSLILTWPDDDIIPSHLKCHFIRGYFDGDGTMYYGDNGLGIIRGRISMTSTLNFCEGLKKYFEIIGIKGHIYKDKNHYDFYFSKKKDIKATFEMFYNDAEAYLVRKYEKFTKFFELC